MSLLLPPLPPQKQHVVSQVLLRQFARGGKIEAAATAHMDRGWRRYSPAAVAYVRDFVKSDAHYVESVWGEIESRLADAFLEIDQGELVRAGSGTERALLDCLALHWARSMGTRTTADEAWERVRARKRPDLEAQPWVLDLAFLQLTGLHPAGREARSVAADAVLEGPEDIRSGQHFADRVVHFYRQARTKLLSYHIAVYDSPPAAEEFVLSDSPVVTPNRDRTGWKVGEVALADAVAFAMPVGPRTVISAHDGPTRDTLTPTQVCELNEMQRRVAVSHVYRRPPGDVG